MIKQDNREDEKQSRVEDLTISEDQAAAMKGGTIVIRAIRFKAGTDTQDPS